MNLRLAPLLCTLMLPCAVTAQGVGLPRSAMTAAELPALRVDVSERARLVVQPPQRMAFAGAVGPESSPATEAGVGVEFKLATADRVPRHLLRVQLSSRSALQLRPRSRGLAVTYREQF